MEFKELIEKSKMNDTNTGFQTFIVRWRWLFKKNYERHRKMSSFITITLQTVVHVLSFDIKKFFVIVFPFFNSVRKDFTTIQSPTTGQEPVTTNTASKHSGVRNPTSFYWNQNSELFIHVAGGLWNVPKDEGTNLLTTVTDFIHLINTIFIANKTEFYIEPTLKF